MKPDTSRADTQLPTVNDIKATTATRSPMALAISELHRRGRPGGLVEAGAGGGTALSASARSTKATLSRYHRAKWRVNETAAAARRVCVGRGAPVAVLRRSRRRPVPPSAGRLLRPGERLGGAAGAGAGRPRALGQRLQGPPAPRRALPRAGHRAGSQRGRGGRRARA